MLRRAFIANALSGLAAAGSLWGLWHRKPETETQPRVEAGVDYAETTLLYKDGEYHVVYARPMLFYNRRMGPPKTIWLKPPMSERERLIRTLSN